MKKILTSFIAISALIATPAGAEDNHRRDQQHHNEHRGGGWAGPLIGGIIIGSLFGSSPRNRERQQEVDRWDDYSNYQYRDHYRYDRPYNRYERYCVDEQHVEWRYGRRHEYWTRRCN